MTTIHMDLEQVKTVLDLMDKDEAEIRDIHKNLSDAVEAINGTDWEGNAEVEFYEEYTALRDQLIVQLTDLGLLADRLRKEIVEWESAGAKLA